MRKARSSWSEPLAAHLVDALATYRAQHDAERVHTGTNRVDTGLVFTRPDGRAIDPKDDYQTARTFSMTSRSRASPTWSSSARVSISSAVMPNQDSQITLTLGTHSDVEPDIANEAA
ncbi:MAG: hypothetical protein WCA29_14570, partial [Jiangellales bacterium]